MKPKLVFKNLVFTFCIPFSVLFWIPLIFQIRGFFHFKIQTGFHLLGMVPVLLGLSLLIYSIFQFSNIGGATPLPLDSPEELVVEFPYTITRNPMYLGIVMALLGESLVFLEPRLIPYSIIIFVNFHAFVLFYEEPHLKEKMGKDYEKYLENTRRWIF